MVSSDRTRRRCSALAAGLVVLLLAPARTSAASCAFGLRAAYDPRSFLGYACATDCRRHKAGFAWAERQGIANAEACAGRGEAAFVEGCRAYADGTGTAEQAGHDWARDNEVTEACACTGAGPRFEAGCAAYLGGPED